MREVFKVEVDKEGIKDLEMFKNILKDEINEFDFFYMKQYKMNIF